jgi:hypothetical protein
MSTNSGWLAQGAAPPGWQVGAVVEPLVYSGQGLLKDADPFIYYALDFWSWVITNYPGPAFMQAVQAASVLSITAPVAQRYPYLPQAQFLSNQFKFPLLCVGRKNGLTGRKTSGWEHDRSLFDLLYVLPPLDAAQTEALLPIFPEIHRTLRHATTYSSAPAYAPPGGTQGQSPWGLSFASVESVGWGDPFRDPAEDVNYGFLEGAGDLLFPCLRMSGYAVERDMYNPTAEGAVKFTGGDITVALEASDTTTVTPFVQVSTQQAPTITSLSVTTGPAAGGTTTVISGTLFLQGTPTELLVYFGTVQATSVAWVSSTAIMVTTPQMQGSGTVAVTVQNPDGQQATLADAFTFV